MGGNQWVEIIWVEIKVGGNQCWVEINGWKSVLGGDHWVEISGCKSLGANQHGGRSRGTVNYIGRCGNTGSNSQKLKLFFAVCKKFTSA